MRLLFFAAAAVCLAGCGTPDTALEVDLSLGQAEFDRTVVARIVISREDGMGFGQAAPATPLPGLTTSAYDYDGDGLTDVVVEFSRDYPLRPSDNRFYLVPGSVSSRIQVAVRAELYDSLQNRVARLQDAMGRDFAETAMVPGQVSDSNGGLLLAPTCGGTCLATTVALTGPQVGAGSSRTIAALSAGNYTGSTNGRTDLAIGDPGATAPASGPSPAQPAAGEVTVLLAGPDLSQLSMLKQEIFGELAGDQLGAALASADLDGDGKSELVIGAPGAGLGAGRVYVLFGTTSWWSAPSFSLAGQGVRQFEGGGADRLGSAITIADVDGDGRPDIIAGAPGAGMGAGALFVARMSDLLSQAPDGGFDDGGMQLPTGAPAVVGRPGSNLGSGLAALGDEVAAGAPLDQTAGTITGAVYLFAASDLATARDAAQLGRWVGAGGRFGTSVELAAFDSTGPWLVAGAPADGRGRVDVIGGLHPPLSGDVATVAHTAAPADGSALFGAALARVRIGGDDGIVVGAPGQLPGPFADGGAPAGTGSVFVIRGATLLEVPVLRLDAAGYPAAASAVGSIAGGAYGGVVAVGRFDDSLAIQIAVAAPGEGAVFVLNGL